MVTSLSLFGFLSAFLLGFIFIFSKGKRKQTNRWLGLIFVLLAIRVGKLYFQEQPLLWLQDIYFNFMHAAFLSLGPSLFFYIKSYLNPGKKIKPFYPHFIPAFLLLFGAFFIRKMIGHPIWLSLYFLTLIHPFFYIIPSFSKVISLEADRRFRPIKIWLLSLCLSISILVLVNILFFFWEFPFYLISSIGLFLLSYIILYLSINHHYIFHLEPPKTAKKYANLNLSDQELRQQFGQIKQLVEQNKLYLEPQLQLNYLALKSGFSVHQVSSAINFCTQKNFSDFINNYRLEEAQKLLIDFPDKKIISIAYESGFHSVSTFNQFFKEKTGVPPSIFRKNHQNSIPDL